MILTKTEGLEPTPGTPPFEWRDQRGHYHRPEDMTTQHVFNTLLMIWNHTVDEPYKFRPYKEYDFGPIYTASYLGMAVRALIIELRSRADLKPYMLDCLSTIASWKRLCLS